MRQPVYRMHGEFHPGVLKAVLLLAALYVLAAWGFAGRGITDMMLVVVSFFFLLSAGLVTLLWRNSPPQPAHRPRRSGPRARFFRQLGLSRRRDFDRTRPGLDGHA